MRALVERAYAARDSGDIMGVVAAFHENGVFQLAGNRDSFALAGSIEGHSDLEPKMKNFIDQFSFSRRKILSFVAEGDRAAVHSRLTVKYKNNTFETEVLDLFTFKDGQIGELIEFADTALIKQAIAE